MNKPDQLILSSLLEKHSLGICTPEEMALLEQWYAAFPENGQLWQNNDEKAALKDSLKAGIFEVIAQQKVAPVTRFKNAVSARRVWWQAAAVLAVLAVGYFIYNKYGSKKEPVYVVVSAPAGKGIVKVELPDHSEVWLEPGTAVRYQKDFGHNGREIALMNGMAFFSVRKNAQLPFVVKTLRGVQTKVLGTEFTVKAYTQEEEVQVMVTSGIVQVSDSAGMLGILKADQQLSYQPKAHITKLSEGKLDDWRTGNIALRDASFAELARIMENRFGLQVVYNERSVAAFRFTLRINEQTTAEDLLEMIKDISGLLYEYNNGKVIIH
ncbi:FecR family protein [Niastella sp. OAS944]|uniref:FecR family protein n=1 Tax=Niastella sp. OAS944 TaxID=2664089 RepID=UPI00346F6DBE|nr:ferric-dicitrate binding protein FerR (iron transport regulator) [Chitinophagaceae bacterium OAS944]